ncbi:MAG TPA: hypothetical protein VGO50_01425 [Pyrinomonadaceae bacterium]|jgi:hypothetical protein|nr:hypothetical protein [Pyrinomonadaceae bacterium]
MLENLRKPFFIIALVVMAIVVLIEIGSPWLMEHTKGFDTPGYGISYMAFIDGLLLYVSILITLAMLLPERVQGRIQGIVTLIVSFFGCLGAIASCFTALIFLLVMVTMLLAPIFGTIAYFVIYGHFDRSGAAITLSTIMTLKLVFIVLLLLAHQKFVENKSLVLLILTSLLCNLIIGFLHNFLPIFLVSITDAVGGIIVAIIAIIWLIIFLVMAIVSIVKAIH